MNNSFTVLMSVYHKENPEFLEKSLFSVVTQTVTPNKILIVKDGDLTNDLNQVIEAFVNNYSELASVVGYKENKGLGQALNFGMGIIDTTYVARMDGDDIAKKERFEIQLNFLQAHPEIDIVGSNILEFISNPSQPIHKRIVPEDHLQIYKKAMKQNPMNHMTVFFKKEAVVKAGGYRHAPFFEDYDLWFRMLRRGCKFHNVQNFLVLARVGNDMIGKRHGWKYLQHEFRHFKNMESSGFISPLRLYLVLFLRLPLRIIPKRILNLLYSLFLRRK